MSRPRRTARSSVRARASRSGSRSPARSSGWMRTATSPRSRTSSPQPADVIGVAVGADDPLQLVHPPADAAQVALEHQPRADHAGIDQRQTLLGDEEGVGTEHPHLVNGRRDLHGAARL